MLQRNGHVRFMCQRYLRRPCKGRMHDSRVQCPLGRQTLTVSLRKPVLVCRSCVYSPLSDGTCRCILHFCIVSCKFYEMFRHRMPCFTPLLVQRPGAVWLSYTAPFSIFYTPTFHASGVAGPFLAGLCAGTTLLSCQVEAALHSH